MGPCWHYVGSFFGLGVFFSLWNASRTFVGRFFSHVRLFRVLGGSGSDVWASRDNFQGPKLLFFGVLSSAQVCNAKKLRMCKNHSFSCVFVWFLHIASFVSKQRKIIPGACSTELSAKIVLPFRLEMDSGGVWRSLGCHLTGFCSLLGGFWPLLGTSWASLGHFLDALGCLLAALWSSAAALRLPGPSQASILKGLGTSQTEF